MSETEPQMGHLFYKISTKSLQGARKTEWVLPEPTDPFTEHQEQTLTSLANLFYVLWSAKFQGQVLPCSFSGVFLSPWDVNFLNSAKK